MSARSETGPCLPFSAFEHNPFDHGRPTAILYHGVVGENAFDESGRVSDNFDYQHLER
jgi:hypothetical protein